MNYKDLGDIVMICGSLRFKDEMIRQYNKLSEEGFVVLMPALDCSERSKYYYRRLDHKKIELSDWIFVVNKSATQDLYIGDDTYENIQYAESLGKQIKYLGSYPEEKKPNFQMIVYRPLYVSIPMKSFNFFKEKLQVGDRIKMGIGITATVCLISDLLNDFSKTVAIVFDEPITDLPAKLNPATIYKSELVKPFEESELYSYLNNEWLDIQNYPIEFRKLICEVTVPSIEEVLACRGNSCFEPTYDIAFQQRPSIASKTPYLLKNRSAPMSGKSYDRYSVCTASGYYSTHFINDTTVGVRPEIKLIIPLKEEKNEE